MNEEILEITKKFHDTYEKLASEYAYETREDTKVFDINSSNGKLMYATVNEIVSPILKENKKQKEVLDKAVNDIQEIIDAVNKNTIIAMKQFNFKLEIIQDELSGSNDILNEVSE